MENNIWNKNAFRVLRLWLKVHIQSQLRRWSYEEYIEVGITSEVYGVNHGSLKRNLGK